MQLDIRRTKGVALVGVSGTITMLDPPRQLKDQVAALVRDGERNIVLNLSHLTFVDSSCIGELVCCSLAAARAGATLKIASPTRRVTELLYITRLAEIFESYETEAAAIASFHDSPQS